MEHPGSRRYHHQHQHQHHLHHQHDPGVVDFSPMTTDTETPTDYDPTPAMPLLPDMPTRSRKLLENLGSSPIISQPERGQPGGQASGQARFRERVDSDRSGHSDEPISSRLGEGGSQIMRQGRKMRPQTQSNTTRKYDFPIKRILLTRDPRDRSVGGNGLGMKVVGGKEIPGTNGTIGAYVAKIYPGGVVETLGEVKEGDQVLEWNGIPLTGKTYEEVQRIIASSGDEVEIVIRSEFTMMNSRGQYGGTRPSPRMGARGRGGGGGGGLGGGPAAGGPQHHTHQNGYAGGRGPPGNTGSYQQNRTHHAGVEVHQPMNDHDSPSNRSSYENIRKDVSPQNPDPRTTFHQSEVTPADDVTSTPVSQPQPYNQWNGPSADNYSESNKIKFKAEKIKGEIQLQICYDVKASILYVTIVRARKLSTTRDNSGLPDPFVKCYLLPGRCMENQRRTRYFSRCSDPEWKQTMVYPNISADELKQKCLEVSVWNYDIYKPNEFLGETVIDLAGLSAIDEQSRWHKLREHSEKLYPARFQILVDSALQSRQAANLANETSLVNSNNFYNQKMARLNNPWPKIELGGDEKIQKGNGNEKKGASGSGGRHHKRKSISSNEGVRGSQRPIKQDPVANVPDDQLDGSPAHASRLPGCCLYYPITAAAPV